MLRTCPAYFVPCEDTLCCTVCSLLAGIADIKPTNITDECRQFTDEECEQKLNAPAYWMENCIMLNRTVPEIVRTVNVNQPEDVTDSGMLAYALAAAAVVVTYALCCKCSVPIRIASTLVVLSTVLYLGGVIPPLYSLLPSVTVIAAAAFYMWRNNRKKKSLQNNVISAMDKKERRDKDNKPDEPQQLNEVKVEDHNPRRPPQLDMFPELHLHKGAQPPPRKVPHA